MLLPQIYASHSDILQFITSDFKLFEAIISLEKNQKKVNIVLSVLVFKIIGILFLYLGSNCIYFSKIKT